MIPEQILADKNIVSTAMQAGQALAAPPVLQSESGRLLAFMPTGFKLEDHSRLLPAPVRLEQKVTLDTPEAFAAYVNLFGNGTRSIVFAKKTLGTFEAVLDYHAGPEAPSWNTHRAGLTLKHTDSWTEWNEKDGEAMNQADFAQFLEDHVPDIAAPAGAELIEVARNFEGRKGVTFNSSQRAHDGSMQFTFNEDVQGTSKAGQMKVPTEFTLGLAPYEGSEKYAVTARLRFRIREGGRLDIWFDLLRVSDVIDAAFADVMKTISESIDANVRAVVLGGI